MALIGALGRDVSGASSGIAYVYRLQDLNWVEEARLIASDSEAGDYLGWKVDFSGDTALLTAPYKDESRGAAYIYRGLADCNGNGILDLCDIADGTSDDLDGNGIPDECQDDCPEDVNGDGLVDIDDIFAVLAAWGPCS